MISSVNAFGVVGSGIMGRGIAEVAAGGGGLDKVVLLDVDRKQLDAAVAGIGKSLGRLVEKGKIGEEQKAAALGRLLATTEPGELGPCGFVVEAVPESLELKGKVLGDIAGRVAPEAVLASNTSSIPITRLAGFVKNPANFIGMHFMNPVPRMKGLEIIKGLHTSKDTCKTTLEMGERFGKQITFSRDRAGFVINRILIPMLNDATAGLDAGLAGVEAVDRYFKEDEAGPRHPMGPFMLSDLIGLDTIGHILGVLEAELSEHFAPAALLAKLVESGACGQKTGKGFYLWERGKPPELNPLVAELRAGKAGDAGEAALLGRRAWLGMMNEAVKVVEEGTSGVPDVDRGCRFCLNHSVGILAALDGQGVGKVLGGLEEMEKRFGPAYKPAPLLRRLAEAGFGGAAAGRGIYSWDAGKGEISGANPVLEEYLD